VLQADKKLKIAMLGHKRIPSREGGVEIVVEELAVRMSKMGHDITCYNRGGHHVSGAKYDRQLLKEYKGVKLKKVFTIDKGGLAALTSSFFASVRAAFSSFDVVHFHAEGPCAMLWLPKLFGKRCIATIHGLDHQRAKWGKFAGLYIKFGEKCAVRFADEIIVLSKNVQKYFRDNYNRETVYIPNGVNRNTVRAADLISEKFGLKKDGYILFLGRLVPEKGISYLIEAYNSLKLEKKLVIAGGASDTDSFAEELKAFANEDVIFTDFVEGQLLEELFSNAYLYVLPSDLEGMPLSLLEAMSYGNCVLTSDIPECTEVINDCGFTFSKGDVNHLREKLSFLCNNPEKVFEMKQKSAEYICNKYNWDIVVQETLMLYKNEKVTTSFKDEKNENFVSK